MKKVGLVALVRYPEVCSNHSIPPRKEAIHAAYPQFHRSPTGVSLRLHRAQLSNLSRLDEWLVPLLPPPLHHRTHSGEWLDPRRSPQSLSSFLQRRSLESRCVVVSSGQGPDPHLCRHWPDRNRWRRYPVSQAWLDHLRHGYASRSALVQPGLEGIQLGTRLGRPLLGGALSLGAEQSLVSAVVVSAVSQPPGTCQRSPGEKTTTRPQPSHAPGIVPRDAGPVGFVVSRAAIPGQRRQHLWRPERAAPSARQRGPYQPCASQGRFVRTA